MSTNPLRRCVPLTIPQVDLMNSEKAKRTEEPDTEGTPCDFIDMNFKGRNIFSWPQTRPPWGEAGCEARGASWRWESPTSWSGWRPHDCMCLWKPSSSTVKICALHCVILQTKQSKTFTHMLFA